MFTVFDVSWHQYGEHLSKRGEPNPAWLAFWIVLFAVVAAVSLVVLVLVPLHLAR